jgi:hypothetical protein
MTATTATSSAAQMPVNVPVLKRQGSLKRSNSLQKLVKVARRISGTSKKSGSKRNDKKMDAVTEDKVNQNAVKTLEDPARVRSSSVGSSENSDVPSVSMTASMSFDDDDAADDFPLESPSPARTTRQISNLDIVSPSSLRPVLETEELKAEPAQLPWVPSMEAEEDVDTPTEQVQEQEDLKATYLEVLKALNFSNEQEYVKEQVPVEEVPVVNEYVPVEEVPVVNEQVLVEEVPVVNEQVLVEEVLVVVKATSIDEDTLALLTDAEDITDGVPRGIMIEVGIMVAVMAGIHFWNESALAMLGFMA